MSEEGMKTDDVNDLGAFDAPSLHPEVSQDVGEQMNEPPSPNPAQPLPESGAVPTAPARPGNLPEDVLPRRDVREVQPAPTFVGTHRVVVDTAPPDPGLSARTAPAPRGTANLGPGESLTTLARMWYGTDDPRAAEAIFQANRDRITNPDALQVGASLVIPDWSVDQL